MKKSSSFLLIGSCAAGLSAGVAGRLAIDDSGPSPRPTAAVQIPRIADSKPVEVDFLSRPSPDTLETLAAPDHGNLYQRLALWIIDANESEIASYWNELREKADRSDDLTGLVFLNWTRLNPQAAIAATAGTEDERHAWWAWACHDPQGALAAAIAADPERVKDVVRGIGEFHPDWLRRNFAEIPASAKEDAISGLFTWGARENPAEMLRFGMEHGVGLDSITFKALIRDDPWGALDWVQDFPKLDGYLRAGMAMTSLISQLAEENPDVLARMAARMPSGAGKRAMEAALFDNLVQEDPEAAIEQAMAIDAPRIAAERFAAVGLSLVKSDPAQALGMAEKLLTARPDAMMVSHTLHLPEGDGGRWGTGVTGVPQFMESLLREDPAGLLDIVSAARTESSRGDYAFDELSEKWLARDVAGFAEWVNVQTDPAIHDRGVRNVVSHLSKTGHFQDAAEWAMALPPDRRMNQLQSALNSWAQNDAAAARAWVENSDLPADDKPRARNGFGP